MPKPQEVATLVVNGQEFRDWTSVEVHHRKGEGFNIFQFTCSEMSPTALQWFQAQFKPGDACEIFLGGELAIGGYLVTRQVAYDANRHMVQLMGTDKMWDAARASVKTATGKFDNYSWAAIARAVLEPFGIGLEIVGVLDQAPFHNVQVQPGETAFELLERLARNRGIILSSDAKGNLVAEGDHPGNVSTNLVEGRNILSAACIITDEFVHNQYLVPGQMSGSDDAWGRTVSKMLAVAPGSAKRYRPLIVPVEHPGTLDDLKKRAAFEARWREGTVIDCQIVVQGWFTSEGHLWRTGSLVQVESPMLMLDEPLGLKSALFRQDARGTTTVLTLVPLWKLPGDIDLSAANPPANRPRPVP